MATHPSIFAWRIPWTEEPGGLQFIRSHSRTQLKQLHTAWQLRKLIFGDERVCVQTSLSGLEQWTETSMIKLIRAMEFSIPSKIFIVEV